ncbi:MAG: ATP-binding protein [Anaerolineales bacterium]|nr:ATP-binding protein [Anaerolineales bacterium]
MKPNGSQAQEDRSKQPRWRHWDRSQWHHQGPWRNWDHKAGGRFRATNKQRGKFFLRFFGLFGLMAVLILGGMGAFAFFLSHLFGGGGRMAALVWLGGCGLSLALPLLAGWLAFGVFRGVATPIADVVDAANTVAEGDLSVRIQEPRHGPDEFRRLATTFNRMTAELERLDQQRRNLTADVAHELRTPLHVIQGTLEGFLDGVYKPTADQVNILLDEMRLLTRLVEDLQLLSTVEAGELTLKVEPVDMHELLMDVATSFSGQMESAGVDLHIEVPEETGAVIVDADPERLDQIISNLVANALRYTPPGGKITLSAQPVEGGVRIMVKDSGEGIPESDLPYVFDRFWKGDRSRSRAGGTGSGLGLAICRNLVHAHGGVIRAESELGVGTTFTIELPIQK